MSKKHSYSRIFSIEIPDKLLNVIIKWFKKNHNVKSILSNFELEQESKKFYLNIIRDKEYSPRLCEEIENYFLSGYLTHGYNEQTIGVYPSITEFCSISGYTITQIKHFTQQYPEFNDTLKRCKEIQIEIIQKKGISRKLDNHLTMFSLKVLDDCFKNADIKEVQHSGSVNMTYVSNVPRSQRVIEAMGDEYKVNKNLEMTQEAQIVDVDPKTIQKPVSLNTPKRIISSKNKLDSELPNE